MTGKSPVTDMYLLAWVFFYFLNLQIQTDLPRCVWSLPVSGAGVILSTQALFIVATAVTFRAERKAVLVDSGCAHHTHTQCYSPKCGMET